MSVDQLPEIEREIGLKVEAVGEGQSVDRSCARLWEVKGREGQLVKEAVKS